MSFQHAGGRPCIHIRYACEVLNPVSRFIPLKFRTGTWYKVEQKDVGVTSSYMFLELINDYIQKSAWPLLKLTPAGCLRSIFASENKPRQAGVDTGGFLRASLALKAIKIHLNPKKQPRLAGVKTSRRVDLSSQYEVQKTPCCINFCPVAAAASEPRKSKAVEAEISKRSREANPARHSHI